VDAGAIEAITLLIEYHVLDAERYALRSSFPPKPPFLVLQITQPSFSHHSMLCPVMPSGGWPWDCKICVRHGVSIFASVRRGAFSH